LITLGKLLLAHFIAVIIASGSHQTNDHIFLSHDSGSSTATQWFSGVSGSLYVDLAVSGVGSVIFMIGCYPVGETVVDEKR
jgi:hypothetical protein